MPEETRRKISASHLGKPKPWLAGKAAGMLGKHHSKETRLKIGLAGIGRRPSPETRIKLSLAGKGRCLSEDSKRKIGNAHRGKKSVNWKGGVTPEYKRIRKTPEYRAWRNAVFARDNYTDQKTGTQGGRLHPHHILNFADYPHSRFDINNGITLSEETHRMFHKKYGRTKNTREQLNEFLKTHE